MDAFLYRVKAAQRDLIERCGGIRRVVDKSGFSQSQVGRWNNATDPDLMPINVVAMLERDCHDSPVTCVLAEINGRRLSDPAEERRADINVMMAHANKLRHGAEVSNALAQAIEDGHVTPGEAHIIDRALAAEEHALSDLRAALAVVKARGGTQAGLVSASGD